ncbi:MAG: TIGR02453 family protein [Candidatus Rokuibacteriota bacterium]|nr:MAG: TIGR02453 family protein [Candidatus Rokubacteria bacterium]
MPRVSRDVFAFLAELRRHNNREWFNENKDRYLAEVRDPMLALIASLAPGLARISRHLSVDPRPSGGSLMRIYRDTRFSRDKTPYKTNVGIHFGLKAPRDFEAPGYYLHLEPGSVFMGAGLWHPGADALRAIREAIVKDPGGWQQARRPGLSHDEVTLKRPPRGFDPDHPLIEDLKRLSFTTGTEFSERQACAPDFPARFVAASRRATPLMRFLARALGLAF